MTSEVLSAFRLEGRTAVVTGASSGLGERFTRVLAGVGATVFAAARREGRLEALSAELPGVVPVRCDVTVSSEREALVTKALERTGQLDILVNNAGVANVVKAIDEDDQAFLRSLEVNLVAPFSLSRLAATAMIERRTEGVIVNVASIIGLVGSGRIPQAGYCASKGGLVNLTRELAAQWARSNIRVNAIAPGWFASEMTEQMFGDEDGMAFIRRNTPMGRPGAAHELDGVLLFLASDASSYVTGQVVTVDGGWTIL